MTKFVIPFLLALNLLAPCVAQDYLSKEYFDRGDRALYFFDIGPAIQGNQFANLSHVLQSHQLPQIVKSTDGIQIGASLYSGKRFIIGTTFLHHDITDSTNYVRLNQRNFELNMYIGYNIFRARTHERFGIIPQVGLYTNRTVLLYEKHSASDYPIQIGSTDFMFKEGKNKIIRGGYGAFSSLRINYATRTQSLIDIFLLGVEPGMKYSLTPNRTAKTKNHKFFYQSYEKRFSPFMNIHLKIPLIVCFNWHKNKKAKESTILVQSSAPATSLQN